MNMYIVKVDSHYYRKFLQRTIEILIRNEKFSISDFAFEKHCIALV